MRRLMVSDLMGAPLRNRVRRLYAALPLHWFVAILVAIDGFIFVQPGLSAVNKGGPQSWLSWFSIDNVHVFLHSVGLVQLPHLVLGMCLQVMAIGLVLRARIAWAFSLLRSEEHTSELQSLMRISYAVFCLKNKKHRINMTTVINHNK